ncbi:hypothetical protein CANINC_001073 [Pichia inconspicua]|uniref:SBE2/SBE22 middle domain-containing protein n=1 Tax=Pichia inconspicua TaxID=52247 RepID=A0A4T0X4J7_9ASCO|nr:hypothetical protein CANINC_001073 [[Candida] inconspicua]
MSQTKDLTPDLGKSRRVSSFSRGFGLSVIDTSQTSANTTDSRSNTFDSPLINGGNYSFSNDADSSIISQSTQTSSFSEGPSNSGGLNIISSLGTLEETDTPSSSTTIDVTISARNMGRRSFTKGSSPNLRRPMGVNTDILNDAVKASPEIKSGNPISSQKFRSTPSLVHPGISDFARSPIPLPKSNQSSPYIPQLNRNQTSQIGRPNLRTKLPRPKSMQQLTKKQKDKLYEENNRTGFEDGSVLMYNVPIASASSIHMFQNGNAIQSRDALRKAWNESESNLIIPPSPLPGKLNQESSITAFSDSKPIEPALITNNQRSHSPERTKPADFHRLSPTAQQLSNFYEYSSHNQAEEELELRRKRNVPSTADPKLIAALDDLTLASTEKLAKLTVTRPSWIPPKDTNELQRHEKEFKKMIDNSSKQALKHSKEQQRFEKEQKYANKRLEYLSSKKILSTSNCKEVKRLILVTNIDKSFRFMLFRKMLTYKLGENTFLIPPFMKSTKTTEGIVDHLPELDILSLFSKEKDTITEKEVSSLQTILQPIARPMPCSEVDVSKLPKIPALPIQTLLPRFASIALKLIRCDYNTPQVRDIIYWLHAYIFTSKFKSSYTKLLKKSTVTNFFKEFKDDYSILTIPTSLDLILDLCDTAVCKFIELFITYWSLGGGRGVKLFVVAIICIIRDYHYGWNNLQVIFHSKAHVFIGNGDEKLQRFFSHILEEFIKASAVKKKVRCLDAVSSIVKRYITSIVKLPNYHHDPERDAQESLWEVLNSADLIKNTSELIELESKFTIDLRKTRHEAMANSIHAGGIDAIYQEAERATSNQSDIDGRIAGIIRSHTDAFGQNEENQQDRPPQSNNPFSDPRRSNNNGYSNGRYNGNSNKRRKPSRCEIWVSITQLIVAQRRNLLDAGFAGTEIT